MRIAVLEDDPTQREALRGALLDAGFDVLCYGAGRDMAFALRRESFDLLVLDWQLPDLSGIDILRSVRAAGQRTPVLFVTIRDDERDVVAALEAGADDYMTKPLRMGEFVARARAVIRRNQPAALGERELSYDRYGFDLKTQRASVGGEPVELTQKEFHLAVLLFRNVGKPLSRGHIREAVWGHGSDVPSRTMDTHVSRVRSKLSLRPESGFLLAPVYSYGYRLEHLGEPADG